MFREIQDKTPSTSFTGVTPVSRGGFGGTTAPEARENLNAFSTGDIGVLGGPIPLTDGLIDKSLFNRDGFMPVAVHGPKTISVGQSIDYYITSYDIEGIYTVEPIKGRCVRNENVIRYTAPAEEGTCGFKLNGRSCNLYANANPEVKRPSITLIEETSTAGTLIITASAFSSVNNRSLKAAEWEISTNSEFAGIAPDLQTITNESSSLTITGLTVGETYWVKMRYVDAVGAISPWAKAVQFVPSTTPVVLSAPSVSMDTVEEIWLDGVNWVLDQYTLSLGFKVAEGYDTLLSYDIEITGFVDTTYSSVLSRAQSIVVADPRELTPTFSYGGEYRARVRSRGISGAISPWKEITFSTRCELLINEGSIDRSGIGGPGAGAGAVGHAITLALSTPITARRGSIASISYQWRLYTYPGSLLVVSELGDGQPGSIQTVVENGGYGAWINYTVTGVTGGSIAGADSEFFTVYE